MGYGLILGGRMDLMWLAGSIGPHWRLMMTREEAIVLIAALLASVAILQIPLWIAKKAFRWRLTRRPGDTEASLQEDRQFNLQHLLIAMFLLAVALSPLRHVLPAPDSDEFYFHHKGTVFAVLGTVILCNLVMTIPCIWWAFASRKSIVRFFLGWLLYCRGRSRRIRMHLRMRLRLLRSAIRRDNRDCPRLLRNEPLAMRGGSRHTVDSACHRISDGAGAGGSQPLTVDVGVSKPAQGLTQSNASYGASAKDSTRRAD